MGTCLLNFLSVDAVLVRQHVAQNTGNRLAAGKPMFAIWIEPSRERGVSFGQAAHQDVLASLPRPRERARPADIHPAVYVASTSRARARGSDSKRKAYSLMSTCSASIPARATIPSGDHRWPSRRRPSRRAILRERRQEKTILFPAEALPAPIIAATIRAWALLTAELY
jgi:hypothetical protein